MGTASCSQAERRGADAIGPDAIRKAPGARYWHDKMKVSEASQAVFDGSQCGDTRRVLAALNANGDPNCVNFAGYTALMLAVGGGYREIVALLLQASGNPNYALAGLTPLMIAAASGQLEVSRMLVNCGATSSHVDKKRGWTALHCASERGFADLVRLLIHAGASVDSADWKGTTALMLAVETGHAGVVDALLSSGVNVSLYDMDGHTALTRCSVAQQEACIDLMLKSGTPLNVPHRSTGDTALLISAGLGNNAICRNLLRYQANVNFMNQRRETPLIVAAEGGHAQVAHLLLLAGADVTLQDLNGHTALMHASSAGHASVSAIALDFGANPSCISPIDGNTALTLAAARGHVDVYVVLVGAGAVVRAIVEEDEYEGEGDYEDGDLNSFGPSTAIGVTQAQSATLR